MTNIISTGQYTISLAYDAFNLKITSSNGFTFESSDYFTTTLQAHVSIGLSEIDIHDKYTCRWLEFFNDGWKIIDNGIFMKINSSILSDVTRIKFQLGTKETFELGSLDGESVTTLSGENISIEMIDESIIIESPEVNLIKYYNGEDGHDGISVSSTTPYFALGTNTTVTGEWTTSFPVRNEGEFVWRKDLTMYSSGSSEFTDPYIVSGLDAESPVNVQFDNENESYNCGYNGSILNNITTVLTVIAHRGIKPITDISIGAIASPSGMAITKSGNKVNITVLAGTALADKGAVTIPIIIDNVSYNKVFSYSKVYNGNPGENVTVASLLNDSCTVTTDNNGENGNFANCTTKMFVWEGIDDVTSGYTFTASTVGISGHFDSNTKNKYIVTAFDGTTENAYVDITASKTGSQSLTKRFTVSMSKTGNPSVSYYISSTAQVIKQSQQNTLTPTVVTFSLMQKIGNSSASYALGYYKVYISDGTTISVVESGHNSSVTYTPSAGNSYIKCEFYEDESCTKLLDEQTIPYILDGIDALRYVITSSKGTVFKHGSLFATDLKCIIYQGDSEVDADGQYTYRWARMNEETSVYEVFNYGKEITETQDGFNMSDQIRVQFGYLENEVLIGKNGNPVTTKTSVQITTVSM